MPVYFLHGRIPFDTQKQPCFCALLAGRARTTVSLLYLVALDGSGAHEPRVSRSSSVLLDPTAYATGQVSRFRATPYLYPALLRSGGPE